MSTSPSLMLPASASLRLPVLSAQEVRALSAIRLYALRREINNASAANCASITGVVLYVLTEPEKSPDDQLAEAQGLAQAHRYAVQARCCDSTSGTRSRWAKAQRAIADRHAHGIIAVSRSAISQSDQLYEIELAWFARHRAALWLVRPESALSHSYSAAGDAWPGRHETPGAHPANPRSALWSSRRPT